MITQTSPPCAELNRKRSVFWVLGGTSGLGYFTSARLAVDSEVFALGRNEAIDNQVGINTIIGNLNDESTWEILRRDIDSNASIDGLVYNVGGSFGMHGWQNCLENYEAIFRLNFLYAVRAVDFFLPHLLRSKSPRIVFVLSKSVRDFSGNTPYVAAKLALLGYLRSVAPKLATMGVGLSGVSPGALDYEHRYPGRLRQAGGEEWLSFIRENCLSGDLVSAEKVAEVICLLLREPSLCFSGSVVDVN